MKKILLVPLFLLLVTINYDGDFDDTGLISGWKFAPLQVDVGLGDSNNKLIDENSHTILSLGLFTLQQKSAVVSFATLNNSLQNNYGIQASLTNGTFNNYGISCSIISMSKKNYGIQVGILYNETVDSSGQICGINIADKVSLGIVNWESTSDDANKSQSFFSAGLFNYGTSIVQVGLLNYNPNSYFPWMPFINCGIGKKK